MKIFIARTAGFCMGVRRAVEMGLDAPGNREKPIFTYGPLIHNPQVLGLLKERGVTVLDEIPENGRGTVLIRAHGVPPNEKNRLIDAGFNVIDATCPRVIKVQTIIKKHAAQGYRIIIIGDEDHPEVKGLLGYAGDIGHVAGSMAELERFADFEKAIIVAQTTQNTQFYNEVRAWALERVPHYKIFDTICDSTEKRQQEVKELAESVDALVVVGGRNSGNTRRLAEIGAETGKSVYHVETESELDLDKLSDAKRVGITAGASTPNWIIRKIYRTIETLPLEKKNSVKRVRFIVQRTLLLTNSYVSIGAGCLCYACCKLQGITGYWPFVAIAVLYVQSMHMLNHLTGTDADHYNDPDRAEFYNRHKLFLSALAIASGGAGLMTALTMGLEPFLSLLILSLLGLSYNLNLVPAGWKAFKVRRIKDIPGSKAILIAAAWGIVTSVFPNLSVSGQINSGTLIVFIWAVSLVFARTAFFDIMDVQGDRIVGKNTIPILLGEKKTLSLIKWMLFMIFFLLPIAGVLNLTAMNGFLMSICPLALFLVITAHQKGLIQPGVRLEFLVESQFILSGAAAFFS